MIRLSCLAAAAITFLFLPGWESQGVLLGAALLVALAMALAVGASATVNGLSAAGGALGALCGGLLVGPMPIAAGACLLGLAYAERTLRVDDPSLRVAHVCLALAGGAAAGYLAVHYATAPWSLRAVVAVVTAVLAAAPLLVEADDPIAYVLDGLAHEVGREAGQSLRDAAELRRQGESATLDPSARRHVRDTWKNLMLLAHTRVRLERHRRPTRGADDTPETSAVAQRVDERIAEHVAVLRKAHRAADAASAAEASLDDEAMRTVDSTGDTLEALSRAIVDDV